MYLCPKIACNSHWKFNHYWESLMAGLSGTSFTGYPLPDVAAGINLKNQVKHWIELCQRWKVGSALKHLQGQIFKKDLFGKESAAGRNLRKRMSGTAEVLPKIILMQKYRYLCCCLKNNWICSSVPGRRTLSCWLRLLKTQSPLRFIFLGRQTTSPVLSGNLWQQFRRKIKQ